MDITLPLILLELTIAGAILAVLAFAIDKKMQLMLQLHTY